MIKLKKRKVIDRLLLLCTAIIFVAFFFLFSRLIGAENVFLIFIALSIFEHLRNIIKTFREDK
jgi:hypothetical protein